MKITNGRKIGALQSKSGLIRVFPAPGAPQRGLLQVGPITLRCALGRSGVTHLKREGDGATPAGRLRLVHLHIRADRVVGRPGMQPHKAIRPEDGWCDDRGSGSYNCAIRLPSRVGHEHMWRNDRLYDLVGVLDWNIRPRIRGLGSAIFLHNAREGFGSTEGCIALRPTDLRRLLSAVRTNPVFVVGVGARKRRS